MKLYTESDIRKALTTRNNILPVDLFIEKMTPIELPSYEEIDNFAQIASSVNAEKTQGEWIAYKSVIAGAKWVIEQIKQQVIP